MKPTDEEIVDEWNECEDCGTEHEIKVGHPCPNCGHTNHLQVLQFDDGTIDKG